MRAFIAITASLCLSTAAFAGPAEDAVMQPINKFIASLNTGDTKATVSTMTATQSITDEFAPYHWVGPNALTSWLAGDAADMKAHGVSNGSIAIDKPLTLSISGEHAYVVVPTTYSYNAKGQKTTEKALFTMSLEKTGAGWLIGSWSYGLE